MHIYKGLHKCKTQRYPGSLSGPACTYRGLGFLANMCLTEWSTFLSYSYLMVPFKAQSTGMYQGTLLVAAKRLTVSAVSCVLPHLQLTSLMLGAG